jgi:hypothetical protein
MRYKIKGPWEVTFSELTGQYHIKGMHYLDNDEHQVNANLIAAAPEMLDALELALSTLKSSGFKDLQELSIIESVIKKAKGGQL